MLDDKNSVVEDGDISGYKMRTDEDAASVDDLMDLIREADGGSLDKAMEKKATEFSQEALESLQTSLDLLKGVTIKVLMKKANASVGAGNVREAIDYLNEALAEEVEAENGNILLEKCKCEMLLEDWPAVMADIRKAYETVSAERLQEFETNLCTYIYNQLFMGCRKFYNDIVDIKLACTPEVMKATEKGWQMLSVHLKGLKEVLLDKKAGPVFKQMADSNGWDLNLMPLIEGTAQKGFAYTRAVQLEKKYTDVVRPGVVVTFDIGYTLNSIGQNMMLKMLELMDDQEKKALLCEKLAMSYVLTTDRNKLWEKCEFNSQAKKYFDMMMALSPHLKKQYNMMREEAEKKKERVEKMRQELKNVREELYRMTTRLDNLDWKIRHIQQSSFYFINLFARADVKNLEEKRQKLQENIAVRQNRIVKLEQDLRMTA